jgi:hypothetical protein
MRNMPELFESFRGKWKLRVKAILRRIELFANCKNFTSVKPTDRD